MRHNNKVLVVLFYDVDCDYLKQTNVISKLGNTGCDKMRFHP